MTKLRDIQLPAETKTIDFFGTQIIVREPLTEEILDLSKLDKMEISEQIEIMISIITGFYHGPEESKEFENFLKRLPISKLEITIDTIVSAFVETDPKK